jgi:hypothetical protein
VVSIKADGAFESIKHELQDKPYNAVLTTCDADRQVKTVKRQIRFLKERIRVVRVMMPYKKIPKRFTIKMVNKITTLVNRIQAIRDSEVRATVFFTSKIHALNI